LKHIYYSNYIICIKNNVAVYILISSRVEYGTLDELFSRAVSSCTPTFFFLHPQCYAKTKLSLLFFKNPKMHLNCIYFLHYGLWNPEKFRIGTSGKISDPPIRNSKYASFKKSILDPSIRNRNMHSGFQNP